MTICLGWCYFYPRKNTSEIHPDEVDQGVENNPAASILLSMVHSAGVFENRRVYSVMKFVPDLWVPVTPQIPKESLLEEDHLSHLKKARLYKDGK